MTILRRKSNVLTLQNVPLLFPLKMCGCPSVLQADLHARPGELGLPTRQNQSLPERRARRDAGAGAGPHAHQKDRRHPEVLARLLLPQAFPADAQSGVEDASGHSDVHSQTQVPAGELWDWRKIC